MKNYRAILIIFLIVITAFSIFKYMSVLKEKYDLVNSLTKIEKQMGALEKEKQNLLQELEKEKEIQRQLNAENSGFKEDLRISNEKLTKLEDDFAQSKIYIEQLNSQLTAIKAQSDALRGEKDDLYKQFMAVTKERDTQKARLASLSELKKAIKELKRQMRTVGSQIKEKVRFTPEDVIGGNRGFLIKEGKSTYPAKIKIEVMPALPAGRPAEPILKKE